MPQHERPAAPGGFDMGRLSTASKIIIAGSLVLIISLFLPWQTLRGCAEAQELAQVNLGGCTLSGFTGLGVLVLLLALAAIVWEGLAAAGVTIPTGNVSAALIGAAIAGAAALFGLIKFLTSLGGGPFGGYSISWGAFIGLIASLAVGYGAWLRFSESRRVVGPPPSAPPPTAPPTAP